MHKATQMEEVVKKPKLRLARENGGITNRLAVVIYEDRVRRGSENPGLLRTKPRAQIAKDASLAILVSIPLGPSICLIICIEISRFEQLSQDNAETASCPSEPRPCCGRIDRSGHHIARRA